MIGEPNKIDEREALGFMSGYSGMVNVNISGSSDENIDLYSLVGTGVIGCDVIDTSGTAGNILVGKVTTDYKTVPIAANGRTGLLARFRYIKKTGSVTSVLVLYQKINQ